MARSYPYSSHMSATGERLQKAAWSSGLNMSQGFLSSDPSSVTDLMLGQGLGGPAPASLEINGGRFSDKDSHLGTHRSSRTISFL